MDEIVLGSAADMSGDIRVGDVLFTVKRRPVRRLATSEIRKMLLGPEGGHCLISSNLLPWLIFGLLPSPPPLPGLAGATVDLQVRTATLISRKQKESFKSAIFWLSILPNVQVRTATLISRFVGIRAAATGVRRSSRRLH